MFAAQKISPHFTRVPLKSLKNHWSNLTAQLLQWPHYTLHCPVS